MVQLWYSYGTAMVQLRYSYGTATVQLHVASTLLIDHLYRQEHCSYMYMYMNIAECMKPMVLPLPPSSQDLAVDKIYLDDVNKDALRLTNENHSGTEVIITHQESLNLK